MQLENPEEEERSYLTKRKSVFFRLIWWISLLNPFNWIAIALWWVISRVITSKLVIEVICRWITGGRGTLSKISALIKGRGESARDVIIEITHLRKENFTKTELIREALKISKKLSLLPTAYVTFGLSDFYTELSKGVPVEQCPLPWSAVLSFFAPSVVMGLYLPYLHGKDSGVMLLDGEEGEIYTLGSIFKEFLDSASLLSMLLLYLKFLKTIWYYSPDFVEFFATVVALLLFSLFTFFWSVLSGVAPGYFYIKRLSKRSFRITKKIRNLGAPLIKLTDLMNKL